MFTKLALLAFVAPLVLALTLQVPTNPTTGGTVTINWTATQDDTLFSLFLVNDAFHDTFAIANNVDPSKQTLTLTIPGVPVRDGYELRATNPGNITDVFSNSGSFSIGASTTSSAATVTSSATGTGATSTTAGATTRPVTSSSSFGVIVSSSAASGASAASSGASSAGSAASSASNPAASGNAAVNVNAGGFVAVLLSAIAGAAVAL